MDSALRSTICGAGIGAGLMFLFDPARGARRRSMVRDRVVRAAHKTRDAYDATRRDFGNRLSGAAAEVRSQLSGDGATRGHDGWGGLPVSKGGMTYTTVEMSETQYPHLTEEHEYVTDLAGPGEWRGGNGVRTVQQMVGHEGTVSAIVWATRA